MHIETISIQGTSEWNEDALIINEPLQLYGVLDGSTSLQPFRGHGGETGGYLASQALKSYFEGLTIERVADTPVSSLLPFVVDANRLLRQRMLEAGIDTSCKEALWTSALALIRIHERYIDFAQVGDCMVLAEYADGRIRVVSRDQVAHMDQTSKDAHKNAMAEGLTTREQLWERIKPILLHNRTMMNTSEGYSVMSGEPEVADFIEYGRINRIRLKSLLIVSDGLFLPEEPPAETGGSSAGGRHADAYAELMSRIVKSSLSEYAAGLLSLEQQDKECQRYPRFKVSDDKTGIWIRL